MSYRWLQDTLHEALIDALADRDDELGDELAERGPRFRCKHHVWVRECPDCAHLIRDVAP